MKSKKSKKGTIGIYGGLGPAATDDLNRHISFLTPAAKDQDHPRRIVIYAPDTPDRTAALLKGGEDPLPVMTGVVRQLEKAGATVIGIPCNTAHAFLPTLEKAVSIPIINMIEVTVSEIRTSYPKVKKIGLLATSGTLQTKIYHSELIRQGFEVVVPNEKFQEIVMDGIYGDDGVKQTSRWTKTANTKFKKAGRHLIANGAEVIIMGCTEIPLALNEGDTAVPLVNPTKELASALLRSVL